MFRQKIRFRYFYAHPDHPFVMCAIPKVGTSTLKGWFLQSTGAVEDVARNVHRYPEWDSYRLHTRSWSSITSLLDERLVFGFVRDPVDRIVSAYVDKYVRAGEVPDMKGAVRHLETITSRTYDDSHPGMTFREFVDHLADARDMQLDPHWRPQTFFMRDVPQLIILRIESLSDVTAQLSEAYRMAPPQKRHSLRYAEASTDFLADTPSRDLARRAKADGGGARDLPNKTQLLDDAIRATLERRFAGDLELREHALTELPDR